MTEFKHGIELRKVKEFRENSEETFCGTAELWHNGSLLGHVSNSGQGGEWRFVGDRTPFYALEKWIAENAPRSFYTWEGADPEGYPESLDNIISKLFGEEVMNEEARKKIRNNILFHREGAVYKIPRKRGYTAKQIKEIYESRHGKMEWLSDMPEADAIALLKES